MAREIKLSNGFVAIVDDCDYERLSEFKWHAQKARAVFYAARVETYLLPDGRKSHRGRQMQQDILYPGEKCPKGMKADHINRNPLDNQRNNLRLASNRESNLNRSLPKANKSGYRGVSFDANSGYYVAQTSVHRKHYLRTGFESAEDAARTYNSLARYHHGEYAQLNVIPGDGPQFYDDAIFSRRNAKRRPRKPRNSRQMSLLG